jgi:N-methylhydantoinase A
VKAGNRIAGPALIEERASTTVLAPGDTLEVDAAGNLLIAIGSEA